MSLKNWSTTAASNATVDSINFAEGQAPSSLNDSARALMADVRAALYTKGSDIASATTTDLAAASTEGLFHDITGTTTITGLGTVGAGVWKVIKFEGALTLTHNGTSLILPGAANITTADGDIGIFVSEGSGNWRCVNYSPASDAAYVESVVASANFPSTGTWGDFTSISLTAGDWDVSFNAGATLNGATQTDWRIGISTTSGNSGAGMTFGSNQMQSSPPTSTANAGLTIANYRISLSATTTVYAKYLASYSAGTPRLDGRLSARRMR